MGSKSKPKAAAALPPPAPVAPLLPLNQPVAGTNPALAMRKKAQPGVALTGQSGLKVALGG
jgi:hypothetical protein